MKKEDIELRKVKICQWASEETTCMKAELWIRGKKAADVNNDGRGGGTNIWFNDQVLEKEFSAFCESQPPEEYMWKGEKHSIKMTMEYFVDDLVEEYEYKKKLARALKKHLCFRLPTDPKNDFRQVNRPDSPEIRKWLLDQDPTAIILNQVA
jgi:hypothetical protein